MPLLLVSAVNHQQLLHSYRKMKVPLNSQIFHIMDV